MAASSSKDIEFGRVRDGARTIASMMAIDVERYLSRIGLHRAPPLDRIGLETLQRAHLTSVPFENLDVYERRGVRTDLAWSVPKVVDARRGGWCYELNGAFAALLESLGFRVGLLGATVALPTAPRKHARPTGPDHLALEVRLDRPYLVDVGFGDSFIRPLPLDTPGRLDGGTGWFGFERDGTETVLVELQPNASVPQYRFPGAHRSLHEFDEASRFLQHTLGLSWTEKRFATRLLDGGPDRVTLLADRLRHRRGGNWEERPVPAAQWDATLGEWFELTP